jgi:formamidopyrimidine-DNA glycosylase
VPELPEVENTRRSLEPILGRTVLSVRLHRRDMLVVPGDPVGGWGRQGQHAPKPKRYTTPMLLSGMTLTRTLRHGKRFAIVGSLSGRSADRSPDRAVDRAVEIGLGMSGRVQILPARGPLPPHTHALWRLDDGSRLAFIDHRRFGGLWAWTSVEELHTHWKATLGPDALTITAAALAKGLASAQRPVKAALLDQRVLAGVGNIYADEACFEARVAPHAIAAQLDPKAITRLARAIRRILAASVAKGGSTLRDYANASGSPGGYQQGHRVYGRARLACTSCDRVLVSDQVAQRTTVWCPGCQGA